MKCNHQLIFRFAKLGQNIIQKKRKRKTKAILFFLLSHSKSIKKMKFDETFILILSVSLWLVLRIILTKAHLFGNGLKLSDSTIFMGFTNTYDGWNCNYTQFTTVPLIWLIIMTINKVFIHVCINYSTKNKRTSARHSS